MKNKATQVCSSDLSSEKYTKYQNLARAKSWNLSIHDTEDVFHELCEGAVRSVQRGTHDSLDEALNSQVYWQIANKCEKQRAVSQSLSIDDPALAGQVSKNSLDVAQSSSFDEVDERMVEEDRATNIAKAISILESNVPSHLMRVAKMQMAGMTRKQIAFNLNLVEGTVQYHIEEFRRRAQALLASFGITSMADLEVPNFMIAA